MWEGEFSEPKLPCIHPDTSLPAWQLAGRSPVWPASLIFLAVTQVWPLCNGEHGAVSTENTPPTAADRWTASMRHPGGATTSPWATGRKTTKIPGTLVNTTMPWHSYM